MELFTYDHLDVLLQWVGLGFIFVFVLFSIVYSVLDRYDDSGAKHGEYAPLSMALEYSDISSLKPQTSFSNKWLREINGKGLTPGSFWYVLREKILTRDNHKCTNCGKNYELSVDHKIPLSLGGDNSLENLTTLCATCHELKDGHHIFNRDFDATDNYGKDVRLRAKVRLVAEAIRDNQAINIKYIDYSGRTTHRTISPVRLVKNNNKIYLAAFCQLRNDNRFFRLSRVKLED